MSNFHIGQKVACVDDSLAANPWHRAHPLKKDKIYVIRALGSYYVKIDDSERAWQNWRSRPLTESKTDISIFTKMLLATQI